MELELKWYVKTVKKESGKEVQVYYILVPAKVAVFLRDYKPYLDLEKKTITFRRGEQKDE
jgi:hypothetical protein